MNWPKEWKAEVMAWLKEGVYPDERRVNNFLEALYDIGALKEPPKAREYALCTKCFTVMPDSHKGCYKCNSSHIIRVREVLDGEE